jgi:hypothetical protein
MGVSLSGKRQARQPRAAHSGCQARAQLRAQQLELVAAPFALLALDEVQTGQQRVRQQRGRGGREDEGPRGLQQPLDDGGLRRHEGPGHAGRLAQRAHPHQALAVEPEVAQGPMTLRAQHAEAMRVVDHQQRSVPFGQAQQLGQRRQVAVHAEDGVADDDLVRRLARLELGAQFVDAAEDLLVGAGQACAVDQAGVVERLAEQRRAGQAERRHHGQIGHVAGAEAQNARARNVRCGPGGQPFLQQALRLAVAADERRAARTRAPAARALLQGRDDLRVVGQPQVVVRAEQQARLAVHALARRGGAAGHAQAARQTLRVALVQALGQEFKHR